MVLNRQTHDVYREMRERVIRETEQALAEGLLHPERAARIPTVVAGRAVFTPEYARAFWASVLDMSDAARPSPVGWWRHRLRG